jgi:CheY-like chemotaxis protein
LARILIVDDNRDIADTYASLIGLWGHETRKAYDSESVFQHALAFQPHVVLLDIWLPTSNGFEVAKRLRLYHQLAGLKIVAITGYPAAIDDQKCNEAGIDTYLLKPVNAEDLKAYLAEIDAGGEDISCNRQPSPPKLI